MAIEPVHEIHRRRFGRNLGLGLTLGALVAVIFALTLVKIGNGSMMQGFDHQARASLLPADPDAGAGAAP